jgi:hypothetical protein
VSFGGNGKEAAMAQFNASQFQSQMRRLEQQMRAAQRQAEQQARRQVQAINDYNRKVDQRNRAVANEVNAYNRRAAEYNRRLAQQIDTYNGQVTTHNRQVDAENQRTIAALKSASSPLRYTPQESQLVDRVRGAVDDLTTARECDVFLSYARIDGADTAAALRSALEDLGVSVWFDELAIRAGKSMSRQMDIGLAKARTGVVLLTPAYITGRFWTERELGALLHKNTVIPVLHSVTFDDVSTYSGILGDLAGFTTAKDDVDTIAAKIAEAIPPAPA